ncbi:hypothetical protein RTP6_003065 [Batrachochytrium dendrobatidis]
MTTSILPPEVLLIVLIYTSPQTVCRFEQTCQASYQLVSAHDTFVWQALLFTEIHRQLVFCRFSLLDESKMTTAFTFTEQNGSSQSPEVIFKQQLLHSLAKGETWRDIVHMWVSWSHYRLEALQVGNNCAIISPLNSSTLNNGIGQNATFNISPTALQPMESRSSVKSFEASQDTTTSDTDHVGSDSKKKPLLLLSSLVPTLPLTNSKPRFNPEPSRPLPIPNAISPMPVAFQQVKIARIGTGTISLPTLLSENYAGSSQSIPRQHLWFDNGGQIMRGLDVSPGTSPSQSFQMGSPMAFQSPSLPSSNFDASFPSFRVMQPLRPAGVSVQLLHQSRSDLLILQEIVPGQKLVTIRIWDPRLHPNGPWLASDLLGPTLPLGMVVPPQTITDGNNHERVKGIWILSSQASGASLCGRTLVCKSIASEFDESSPFPRVQGVVCWHLDDANENGIYQDDSFELIQRSISTELEQRRQESTAFNSTPPSPFLSPFKSSRILPSPMRKVWQRDITFGLIQGIVCNELVVAVRILSLPNQANELADQTHNPALVQLWYIGNGSLLADITSDIPSSFMRGSAPIHALTQPYRPFVNTTTAISGLCSISKIPFVGRNVRIDISNDASTVVIAPAEQRGEVIILDMKRNTCTTYLLNDGFLEGAHSRNGSMLGRSVGVWLVSDMLNAIEVDGRRRHVLPHLGGSPQRNLSVAWQSIPI